MLLLLVHLAATLFMTGVIWFVQIVHYPLFGKVGTAGYTEYAAAHSRQTTWVVAPPMLIELITAGLLAVHPPEPIALWQARFGLVLVGIVWISTLFLQVPQHNVLGHGYDPRAHTRLVQSNWVRTVCWTVRSLLVLWMVASCFPRGNT
ncbi:MAG: hypothetical protein RMJ43_14890 [Chloroherpetonaceae bacterium]|nr:hypothetical protein [Chthonomonadaceae bacterium]MDW8209120.1 hypothetical protein [Chloroherpetonaceae bacterium]